MLYFHSLSVVCDFVAGALFAQTAFQKRPLLLWVQRAPVITWILLYLLLFLSLLFYDSVFNGRLAVSLERAWFALLFALVIMEQSYALHSPAKLGKWRILNYLGKRSYGLYCYHGMVLTGAAWFLSAYPPGNAGFLNIVLPVVLFLFTTLAASVSYRFFEQPFLQMKQRYY
jgi:peptidoglycan/LPS O-acetylase OafA/YrhL